MPSAGETLQLQQSQQRRPQPAQRHSSQSSQVSQVSQSPSEASSSHRQGHYKPQRHVVGHGRLGASRNSSSKNLAKLTKVTPANDATITNSQRHHSRNKSGELLESASSSPRPHMKRNASAFVVRNQSHSALKKNFSSGHLPRHASSKNVMKTARHPPALNKRTASNRSENSERSRDSEPPSPALAHHTVRFALGDGDEVGPTDEHDGEGEWTEESASASPHTTRSSTPARSNSISEGPMTGKADAHDSTSEAESSSTVIHEPPSLPKSAIDRTLTPRPVNGSGSQSTSHQPDADAITSRLLQRVHSHNAAPQVTNVSAVVTSESQGSKSLSQSQSSTMQDGTPGRDLVSRFINSSSSSGTPKDGSLLPVKQQRRPDSADLDSHKRNKSTPNFVEPDSSPTSSLTSRTLTHGTTTPSELPPSRTQIKMQLMRASSNIEQIQKGVPAVLPRANAAHIVGHGGSFSLNQGVAPQIQALFSQTAKEYQIVRRFRNPVGEAIHRLGEIPGTSRRNTHIPKQQKGKAGYLNGGDGKYGLSQSYRSREERQNETEAQQARHGHLAPNAAQRNTAGHKSRVSFDLPRGDEDEDDRESVRSDDGRIVRDEAYEICRRLWDIGDVAEGG
ncbi:hypothetical protein BLS_001148 [Venturia inaequalis]|uniref:Uncharacterized protein n=1 Tax=Venturia inaequalis TaxID=5025 RepID=A0A8H3U2A6_VENIN|nr:hypothetical protein BLS_001148 [Venturia inaequalis]RDI77856.1 hypothetical protein Vi05172_g12190 [Venturia inaequalis]